MLRKIVTKAFDDKIKTVLKGHKNVINFLLKHERKDMCINNLLGQIKEAEKSHCKLNTNIIKTLTSDFAVMFANTALKFKEGQLMSQTAKANELRILSKNEEHQKFLDSDDEAMIEEYAGDQ